KFKYDYLDNADPFTFTSSSGQETKVRSFGVLESRKNNRRGWEALSQVKVLFHDSTGFALDLCKLSKPYQVVLARMKRQETLDAMIAELRVKTTKEPESLPVIEELLVPT